jgi:choline dehydrogenase-like flavoprotein
MNSSAQETYDAIVVGSGPGGSTVARELSAQNSKVLILEWGADWGIKGTAWQTMLAGGIPGKSLLFTHGALAMIRAIITGGSSVFYYATAFDPPIEMLKSYGLDITEEVAQIRDELPVAVLKDELIGPGARRIMASAQELGYDWQKLPKFVFQDKCRKDCWRCNYGCPYGAKWNARHYVDQALENGATLINQAKVEQVIVEGNMATGVRYKLRGKTHRAYASKVILAAGGTVKIGEIIDANLQTEIDSLYVCDCSVIPEAWGLPPTYTLLALGKRLAKHITGTVRSE